MAGIVFAGMASPADPSYDDVSIEGIPYRDHMADNGVAVVDGFIESCHGCPDRMGQFSADMETVFAEGNKVALVITGGLYFALPSLQATQVRFPVISVPTDYVAFQAGILPTGHAVIGTVGVDPMVRDNDRAPASNGSQRSTALHFAERIVSMRHQEVCNIARDSNGELEKALAGYDIPFVVDEPERSLIHLAYTSDPLEKVGNRGILVRGLADADVRDWQYLERAERSHHEEHDDQVPAVQVHGAKNIAVYAMKILGLGNRQFVDKINVIAAEKASSYGPMRDLAVEAHAARGGE